MNFQDTITIQAEATRVWDLLMDVDRFAACVPGVQEVKQIDERTFEGSMVASVGPISGRFSFEAQIVESNPPVEMLAELNGTDSVTRSALLGTMAVTLDAVGPNETRFSYRSVVDINGRLAIVGDMVLRATATLVLDEFVNRLRKQLEE